MTGGGLGHGRPEVPSVRLGPAIGRSGRGSGRYSVFHSGSAFGRGATLGGLGAIHRIASGPPESATRSRWTREPEWNAPTCVPRVFDPLIRLHSPTLSGGSADPHDSPHPSTRPCRREKHENDSAIGQPGPSSISSQEPEHRNVVQILAPSAIFFGPKSGGWNFGPALDGPHVRHPVVSPGAPKVGRSVDDPGWILGGTVRPLGRGAALPQPPRSPRQLVCKTDMMIPESKIEGARARRSSADAIDMPRLRMSTPSPDASRRGPRLERSSLASSWFGQLWARFGIVGLGPKLGFARPNSGCFRPRLGSAHPELRLASLADVIQN